MNTSILIGNREYLYSRFSDDPAAECVKSLYAVMSWLYEDGSADSGDGELDANPDECITGATMRLSLPSFTPHHSKYSHPAMQILFIDPKRGEKGRVESRAECEEGEDEGETRAPSGLGEEEGRFLISQALFGS
jgi:hypothetical protein